MCSNDLWDVGVGLSARIENHDDSPENAAMRRRLMDIGFTEGAETECVLANFTTLMYDVQESAQDNAQDKSAHPNSRNQRYIKI